MRKALSSTALAAGILLLCVETYDAQARQQCSAGIPARQHGYWSYRLIDGRKCWYEGKPGLSKSLLAWGSTKEARDEARQESRKESRKEPKPEPKQARRQEPRPEPESEQKPEVTQTQQDESFVRPALRARRDNIMAERPQDPFDAQAWAQEDSPTFEALWRSRAQSFR